jgi:hypothetical protein
MPAAQQQRILGFERQYFGSALRGLVSQQFKRLRHQLLLVAVVDHQVDTEIFPHGLRVEAGVTAGDD